jgi:hypothetical protein
MNIEGYSRRQEQVGRWKVNIVSYKVGDQYCCTVDNVEPGATLARGQGCTRGEAEKKALDKAKELVAKTRVVA